MRRLVVLPLVIVSAGLLNATPASATCMETFNKAGVRMGTCAPPGGPAYSYVCVGDVCHTT